MDTAIHTFCPRTKVKYSDEYPWHPQHVFRTCSLMSHCWLFFSVDTIKMISKKSPVNSESVMVISWQNMLPQKQLILLKAPLYNLIPTPEMTDDRLWNRIVSTLIYNLMPSWKKTCQWMRYRCWPCKFPQTDCGPHYTSVWKEARKCKTRIPDRA